MKNITNFFKQLYFPTNALVFYRTECRGQDGYVEYFDMDRNGSPINAHPLTVREAERLAKMLHRKKDKEANFLKPKGVMPNNILHLDAYRSRVVWFTKMQRKVLLFGNQLEIESGTASIPPMLWVADRNALEVFALGNDRRPVETTKLFHAPFFNIYEDGKVCMGTVDVKISPSASVEEFMLLWEDYFFNSYFSHLMEGHNPISGNCVALWKSMVNGPAHFPMEVLKTCMKTLKDVLL